MGNRGVSYDDVRQFLGARSPIASNLGAQLDRMRDGCQGPTDHKFNAELEHARRLRSAAIIRCVDGLLEHKQLKFAHMPPIPDLQRFARQAHLSEGEVVIHVLRAFETWSTQWPEKGLAEVYCWLQKQVPQRLRFLETDGELAGQLFREGRAKVQRRLAMAVVADAHVALQTWVTHWAQREIRRAA